MTYVALSFIMINYIKQENVFKRKFFCFGTQSCRAHGHEDKENKGSGEYLQAKLETGINQHPQR